jgi:organic hydroperoxide reductase OsmC/OhrA
MHRHKYNATITWTGNSGKGTVNYKAYERSHTIKIANKADILGSSDASFNGDKTKHNPEELLLASLSTCHMLWYLSLCAAARVVVLDYTDDASGTMLETEDGSGHFIEVTLRPKVTVAESSMVGRANELHEKANKMCFIANSVNFPVHHEPTCDFKQDDLR